ncbi:MAG: hypothetical protein V7K25_11670 [Nostoc sp.]
MVRTTDYRVWMESECFSSPGAMRFCEVLKIRVLNHLFSGAIAAK